MSAIFGLVRLDGRDVTAGELEAMRRPMAYWGPDGGGTWRDGGAGLGQLVARATPEDEHERGPVALPAGTVVTPAGRLDNRDELCAELGVPAVERASTPDGRIIALAYGRWGEDAPRRLLGDWAFAAWHPRERRLVLARDHYGQTALYYHRSGPSLAFASSLKGLLALPEVPRRLDELQLARLAIVWPGDGSATMYEGVERLPPAHTLAFDRAGVRRREFWHPRDAPAVRLASDEEYLERFLDVFAAAVRARLRASGPVATMLSAGLDSAAVTALAARELDGRPLTAYTGRPAYPEVAGEMPGVLVDEWQGAELVANRYRNVRHVASFGKGKSPVEAMARSVWAHEEPEHSAANLAWTQALLEQARAAGDRVLLSGQMGNCAVSWDGDDAPVLTALAARDARGVARALRHARDLGRGGWAGGVLRGVVRPLRRRVERERIRRDPRRFSGWAAAPLAPAFVERIRLRERARAAGWDPAGARATLHQRRLECLLPGTHVIGAWWHENMAAHGLDARDPTVDVRLLELCFGLPDEQFASGGQDRRIMRRAVERLGHPEAARNRRRGAQAADAAHRLRADAARVDGFLADLRSSDVASDYLDLARMERDWRAVRSGVSAPAFPLTRGMMLGAFLLRRASLAAGRCD
ncbi:MAG TPA: asparagine synthase-related protein [Solirubrobacteraceae bacterium]